MRNTEQWVCAVRIVTFAFMHAAGQQLDLTNWMAALEPIIGESTLLDLSLPGAHDAMTFDLSDSISDGGLVGLPADLRAAIDALPPKLVGHEVKELAQTQGLNITGMLEAGVRFIDFRIMYTHPPDSPIGPKDWYSLHAVETLHKSITYLQSARAWLDTHPKEIVVFWASRHGNPDLTGTDQYPGTTPAQRQAFFQAVKGVFGSMLFDSSIGGSLNKIPVSTLWKRGQRVVWYASDYVESTDSSSQAVDGHLIDNRLPMAGPALASIHELRTGKATLAGDKVQNRFFLMSMAFRGPEETCFFKNAAFAALLPIGKGGYIKKCAKCFAIPGMDSWCPDSLQAAGQMFNYYNQLALETAYLEGGSDENVDFPNAIYIDGVDTGGRIRMGTERLNPLAALGKDDHATTGYAYSATMIGATVRRLCRRGGFAMNSPCEELQQKVDASRGLYPLQRWNDITHGRAENWPPIPNISVVV